jgi:ankyrin repeat protein
MKFMPSENSLYQAVSIRDVKTVILLTRDGFNMSQWQYEEMNNRGDLFSLTAIEKAVDIDDLAILRILLEVKPDSRNFKEFYLYKSLEYSSLIGRYHCFAEILSCIDNIDILTCGSILAKASIGGSIEIARNLLKLGVDVNFEDDNYRTPLMNACVYGHLELVVLLIQNSADIYLVSRESPFLDAITFAEIYKRVEIYNYLLSLPIHKNE